MFITAYVTGMGIYNHRIKKMKVCTKCHVNKPEEDYGKSKKNKGGLKTTCKPCVAIYQKVYRIRNKTKLSAYGKAYKKANKETIRETSKRYYANTREERLATIRNYNKANKERLKEYARLYWINNKVRLTAKRKERLAKLAT